MRPAARSSLARSCSLRWVSISAPFSTRNVSVAAWPTRLFPSTKGWFPTSEKPEGRRLIRQRGIEIETGQRHLGLSEGRFERAEIPNPSRAAGLFEKSPMKLDD